MKVMLVPRYDVRSFMSDRSLGREPRDVVHLYKSLGGNVI